MPIPAGPGAGTVAPCAWTIDTSCCSTWADYGPALQLAATRYATLVMWAATGRRYGLCDVTVRPCGRSWSMEAAGTFLDDGGMWSPYVMDGVWHNCGCGSVCCCEPDCQVYLPGPVHSIASVHVDGLVIDPATYRVDDRRWLVRTGTGNCWPDCVNMNVDSGAGLFEVTYFLGLDVPAAVSSAAGVLACEYAKACMGATCRLPQRVTSVARQGVTITMVDVDMLLERGLTGITEVDQVIRAVNPNGLKGRPRLYTPDLPNPRVVTG